jgi:hypothetical protein
MEMETQQAFQPPSSLLAFNVINKYERFKNNAYIIMIIIAGKWVWNI